MKKILIALIVLFLFLPVSCSENKQDNDSGAGDTLQQNSIAFEKTLDGRYYTVTGIGTYSGENVVIPSEYNGIAVESISAGAFSGNTNIKTLTIESGVKKIGSSAFSGCTSLVSVEIASTLKKMDSSVFEGCYSIETLIFGNELTDIGNNAFAGCDAIENLYYEGTEKKFSSIRGITQSGLRYSSRYFYSEDYPSAAGYYWHRDENGMPCVWFDYIGSVGLKFELSEDGTYYKVRGISDSTEKNVVIPRAHKGLAVKEIDSMAFTGSYMRSVEIPDTITKIASSAFKMCAYLSEVRLPDNIEEIGENAFSGCNALKAIILTQNVKSIGKDAFSSDVKIYFASDRDSFSTINYSTTDAWVSSLYFYSETQPIEDGNYWHYDANGEIVEWQFGL